MSNSRQLCSSPAALVAALAVALTACNSGSSPGGGEDGLRGLQGPWATLAFPNTGMPPAQLDVVPAFGALQFDRPLFLTHAPDGTDRLFVVEQPGRIHVFPNDPAVTSAAVFLDIAARLRPNFSNEEGLLGLAFDPAYATNGHFYVHYTADAPRRSVLARYSVDPTDPDRADPGSERILLEVIQPAGNHNGGMLAFGPDGMLYASFGDGGGSGDPSRNGQDRTTLLGTLVRIDPDHGSSGPAYRVPPDNPFVGEGGGVREEIWAFGLRHPWRFSFDRGTGELWLGDVGQVMREEIDLVTRGANLGWNVYEGTLPFDNPQGLPSTAFVAPVVDYDRVDARSIIGGYVYRGARLPQLRGSYLHGDYATGMIRALRRSTGAVVANPHVATVGTISSFGEDRDGEVYALSHGTGAVLTFALPAGTGGGTFPAKLSETGLFRDVRNLIAADGVLDYRPRSELWSDGSLKRRWIVLPRSARIGFRVDEPWDFPIGTVLVKHFGLDLITGDPASRRRLETRVMIHEEDGWAGYTYRWRADHSDADLLADRETESLTVLGIDGDERTQVWTYPSRIDCLQCHTEASGRVLGVGTRQLNHRIQLAASPREQLDYWNSVGTFTMDIASAAGHPRMANPRDEAAPIADRARAYLDANCAMCHRPGGPAPGGLDLRIATPDGETGLIDVVPTGGDLGLVDARRVAPGAKERSVLWARLGRTDGTRMPPLGSVVPDDGALELIGRWIDSLSR